MIGTIISALTGIGGVVKSMFNRYQERKQAEHRVRLAREEAKRQIALKAAEAEYKLSSEQLSSTSKFFKHLTFFMWFGPFIVTTVFPDFGLTIFANWKLMPEWYAQSCVALMFVIWGVQVGKGYISNIFSSAGRFFRRNKDLKFRRKLFYDVVRSSKGHITQAEVELYEKAINEAIGNANKNDTGQ